MYCLGKSIYTLGGKLFFFQRALRTDMREQANLSTDYILGKKDHSIH